MVGVMVLVGVMVGVGDGLTSHTTSISKHNVS